MSDLTLYPADIAAMSVSQIALLSPYKKFELDKNVFEAIEFLKVARTKIDAAWRLCYEEQAKAALLASGRDFGTTYIKDGPLRIKFDLPKKVTWDQAGLNDRLQRIVAAGEDVKSYIDVKLSVAESRYTNWPPALQQQFAGARTVDAGKPSFTLTLDQEVL